MSAYKCHHSDFSEALNAGDQNLTLAQVLPHYPKGFKGAYKSDKIYANIQT